MKLQNGQTKSKVTIINIVLLIIFFTSLFFIYFDIVILEMEGRDKVICVVSLVFICYMIYLGCPFFRYDSEGETLIFQNKKSLPISFFVKEIQSDFPKRKLKEFKIKRKPLFKKKLEIYIHSKRTNISMTKIDFDISYLTPKEVRDLNISLNKVIKENAQYYCDGMRVKA